MTPNALADRKGAPTAFNIVQHSTSLLRNSTVFGGLFGCGRIFYQVWRHTFGDVTRYVTTEYFVWHLVRIFCRRWIHQMWHDITVVWAFCSVKYCLINIFQESFLRFTSVFLTRFIYQHRLKSGVAAIASPALIPHMRSLKGSKTLPLTSCGVIFSDVSVSDTWIVMLRCGALVRWMVLFS